MRVVLDTNVLVSGLLGRHTAPLLRALSADRFTLLLSDAVSAELTDVLSRPAWQRLRTGARTRQLLRTLRRTAIYVRSTPTVRLCRDPRDNKFLALAWAGRADFLVTGDHDLRSLRIFRGTRIVTPGEFLRRLRR